MMGCTELRMYGPYLCCVVSEEGVVVLGIGDRGGGVDRGLKRKQNGPANASLIPPAFPKEWPSALTLLGWKFCVDPS